MNGVTDDILYKKLVDIPLQQVCFGENEIILNFDNNVRITVFVDLIVLDNGKQIESSRSSLTLVGLLGSHIRSVNVLGNDTLELQFASGISVRIVDESRYYESATIDIESETIII
jgi:hypothetical protein